jgi:PadR family transcriptional regulator, regulatory protein PadR
MPRTSLGELEHLILVAILRLEDRAYGAAVIAEIERQTGRDLSHAATYLALQRLRAKGLIAARAGSGATERGGRARFVFSVTKTGRDRLRESAAAIFTLWKGLDPALRSRGKP